MMRYRKVGGLGAQQLKGFLDASYNENAPKELEGYKLDESISNKTGKVYINPETGHTVVAHRGTEGARDWLNNAAYLTGMYEHTARYKRAKKLQEQAEAKYGSSNVTTVGHSQGGMLASKLGQKGKEVITVNKAFKGEKQGKNEYNVRSSSDVVSGLYSPIRKAREWLTGDKSQRKKDVTIKSKSATDVLGEHSYNILDRVGDKQIGKVGGRRSIVRKGR